MDRQYEIPITKIDTRILERLNLEKYTHFIFPSYSGNLSEVKIKKIKSWIEKGGTLILYREAIKWAKRNKLIEIETI